MLQKHLLKMLIRRQSVNCSVRVSCQPQFRIKKSGIFGTEKGSFHNCWHMVIKADAFFYGILQFVMFNPWKIPRDWIAFSENSFVTSPGLLYHLIRRDTGRLANEAFTSNPIVSSKQQLSCLKITNCLRNCSFAHELISSFEYVDIANN